MEASLYEPLLLERVPHLYIGTFGLFGRGIVAETGRSQDAYSPNAVTTSSASQKNGQVSHTASPTQYETVGRQDAAAEYIDERVVGKTLVEDDLATDSRDSDRITVTRYSRDHTRRDPAGSRVFGRAKPQGIH